jgi:lysophospholipase L1-like esterase
MNWYEEDVQEVITERDRCPYEPKTIFYGSSSIRLWRTLYDDFAKFKPVNLGFGGSTLAACVWFFDRIMNSLRHPKTFILYAGDNDLGDGRHPEEVLFFFREFMVQFRKHYPHIPFYYISIKPSLSRQNIMKEIIYANSLIRNEIKVSKKNDHFVNVYSRMIDQDGMPIDAYFEEDGLHLNGNGYALWKEIILKECFHGL